MKTLKPFNMLQRMKSKLSEQGEHLRQAGVPLPLYTCLHVKKNISAKVFQVRRIKEFEFLEYRDKLGDQ